MTRYARTLIMFYASTSLWLAWCATLEARDGTLWAAIAFGISSLAPIIAIAEQAEQAELVDLREADTAQAVRAARRREYEHNRAAQLVAAGLERADTE